MIVEFKVGAQNYRADKLDAFQQWDVARRLLPVVGGAADVLVRLFKDARRGQGEGTKLALSDLLDTDVSEVVGPLAKAMAAMSDADSRFVLTTCLAKVSRQQQGGAWAAVTAPNGALMFMDIDMPVMLQLVWKVIEHNLLNFSLGPAAGSN